MNADGFHHGGLFLARQIQYPEDEVSMREGRELADEHLARGLECRIINGGDELIFHAKGSKVIFPPEGAEAFWQSVGGYDVK